MLDCRAQLCIMPLFLYVYICCIQHVYTDPTCGVESLLFYRRYTGCLKFYHSFNFKHLGFFIAFLILFSLSTFFSPFFSNTFSAYFLFPKYSSVLSNSVLCLSCAHHLHGFDRPRCHPTFYLIHASLRHCFLGCYLHSQGYVCVFRLPWSSSTYKHIVYPMTDDALRHRTVWRCELTS